MKTEIELITESARKAKRKRLESVDPKEIKQVLAKAVKKIEKGTATFTTGSFARNKKGLSCPVGSHSARQFCSVGLVHRVVGIEPTETLKKQRRLLVDATTAALVDTYNAIYNAKEINITIINDYRLANGNANLFREALKRIEKEIENEGERE